MAELRSALLSLTLPKDLMDGMLGVIIEGDSAYACSTLNRILTGFHERTVECSLAKALNDFPRLFIVEIDRTANSTADYVANIACVRDFMWERGMPLTQAFFFILSQDFVPL
ncbi:hypothetical protein KSP40_PGU001376 [Platanthera guangdongensis]|uniref:RNase H type-1 domain-containing protein n=1 Tax=Platanthera guangdongensis TaxID=2320717 RepID=A0ABR2M0Y1_9ASPA